jgi:hypothetical protein
MIDNPLPDQVMEDYDNNYLSEQFYEHCEDKAKEIAEEFNLLPEFLDICLESDEGYSLINDKSLIEEWWEANKDVYEDPSPYEDYEPTDDEMMSSFGTKWHDGL